MEGSGNDSDIRRAAKPAAAGNGTGGKVGERLARIEAQLDSIKEQIKEHGATKEDIAKVKNWFLCGVLAAIGIAIPAAVGVAYVAASMVRAFG